MPVPKPTPAIWNLALAMVLILGGYGCGSPSQGMADAAPEAGKPDAGTACSSTQTSSYSCTGEFTCNYGTETCCGITHPSTVCECSNNEWSCIVTDACLRPRCDGEPTGVFTASVSEFLFTDPEAAAVGGFGGLSVEALFHDPDITPPVFPVYGNGTIGSCTVYHHQVDALGVSTEPPGVDVGLMAVSGSALRAALDNPCSFDPLSGRYECVVDNKTGLSATVTAGSTADTTHYTFAGIDFSAAPYYLQDATGNGVPVLHITLSGFTDPSNNGTFAVTGIVAGANDTVVVLHPTLSSPDTATSADLRAITGAPTRAYSPTPGTPRDYLNGGTINSDTVTIAMGGNTIFPVLAPVELKPAGQGFKLDSTRGQPHQFPATTQAIEWSCGSGDGSCGPAPELFTLFRISGRTAGAPLTDGVGSPLPAWEMPVPPPNSTYATFECDFIFATAGTLPTEAVGKILETNPTRIETRISYESVNLFNGESGSATFSVGHGLVGHTTP